MDESTRERVRSRASCNLHKGPNLAGVDPETGELIELFHLQRHRWDEHFGWHGIHLVGKTPVGRVTVAVLAMNSDEQLTLRSS